MKTSNGKYIAPQYIEGKIGKDKFIEQIAIIADAKKYVSALIVPCFDSVEEYAKKTEYLSIKIAWNYSNTLTLLRCLNNVSKVFKKELAHFETSKEIYATLSSI